MPVIWQLSEAHYGMKTILRGVLIQEMPDRIHSNAGKLRNLINIFHSYSVRSFENEEITIEANGDSFKTKTDENGAFSLECKYLSDKELRIYSRDKSQPFKIHQTYPIRFSETSGRFEVISDIDDTLMLSYTADFFKRVSTVALKNPYKRKTIDYTLKLFKELKNLDSRFFYVSKSEGNLFGMIYTFLEHHNFPQGDIFLTPFLTLFQLVTRKKDKAFKEKTIVGIIEKSNKSFVLVGDDSQQDMEIYFNIAVKYPTKIFYIFIRQTKNNRSRLQKKKWEKLRASGVAAIYFDQNDVFDKSIFIT